MLKWLIGSILTILEDIKWAYFAFLVKMLIALVIENKWKKVKWYDYKHETKWRFYFRPDNEELQ